MRASRWSVSARARRGGAGRQRERKAAGGRSESLLPLVVALGVFLAAPRASHSLYCYYATGALLTSARAPPRARPAPARPPRV